jgi:microcin C transport system permease protein
VQFVPGGPVEIELAKLRGTNQGVESSSASSSSGVGYQGSKGLSPELVEEIRKYYGFDKPAHVRFWEMLVNYIKFDFGNSYFRDEKVINLIKERLPVSISLGLWSTILVYLIAVPLGIKKAVRNGQAFDSWSSLVIIVSYAIPSFVIGMVLLAIFAINGQFGYFPIKGIISRNWDELDWWHKITDYIWHVTLPTCTLVLSGFATLVMLTKNSFLEEINKQYVLTAKAKGLTENQVLYGHVFRNAMLLVISGIPKALIKVLFTGSLLVEIIFSLEGLGLLSYEAAISRDYQIVFATLYIYTLIGLVLNLVSDLTYVLVDPRIDFESAER